MYYVYIIQNSSEKLYYGYTSDLRERLKQHNKGSTRTTRGESWKLVYYEAYVDKRDALEREKHLKRYGQSLSHLKRRIRYSLRQN